MVNIRRYSSADHTAVQSLAVNPDQVQYVGGIDELFESVPPTWHFHVVEHEGDIVGFFNIDTAYAENYDFAEPNELGLRAFFIDASTQGRGYGKAAAAALQPYLVQAYPKHASIALTVNCRNQAAYHCYLAGGFSDTGSLYHGGKAGPQHIMRMPLYR